MKNLSLEEAVESAKSFYIENNYSLPNSVAGYIACFPPGLSRQMLSSRFNIKTSEFVKLLNPEYERPLNASERVLVECARLGYELITDPTILTTNRNVVEVRCMLCGYVHKTTINSLSGSSLGCPKCKSGNLPWNKREEELRELLLERFKVELISEIPNNELGDIRVKHLVCGTEYSSQLLGFIHPNSPQRGSCPNCRSSDRRITVDGKTFGSLFEYDCYKVIEKFIPEVHVKYSDWFITDRRWVCDFKVKNFWIEVSNFKTDYKNYFQNIADKERLVEENNHHFFFIQSLKEMRELASLM